MTFHQVCAFLRCSLTLMLYDVKSPIFSTLQITQVHHIFFWHIEPLTRAIKIMPLPLDLYHYLCIKNPLVYSSMFAVQLLCWLMRHLNQFSVDTTKAFSDKYLNLKTSYKPYSMLSNGIVLHKWETNCWCDAYLQKK